MSPGLALLIGILIGAAVVYFLKQAQLQQRIAISQNSQNRTDQLAEKYERDLAQRLAEQRSELEAEYKARLAALGGEDRTVDETSVRGGAPSPLATPPTQAQPPEESTMPSSSRTSAIEPPPIGAAATVLGVAAGATVLPDPWEERPTTSSEPEAPPEATVSADEASIPAAPAVEKTPVAKSVVRTTLTEPTLPLSLTNVAAQLDNPLPEFRRAVAQTLGEAAATNRREITTALPMLGKLCKDPDPSVRLAAIQALHQCASAKAVPLLRQSLRDPNGDVVAAASIALSRFKGLSRPKPQKAKKKRPKNR